MKFKIWLFCPILMLTSCNSYNKERILNEAESAVKTRNYELGARLYSEVLAKENDCSHCLFQRGLCRLKIKKYDGALSDFTKYIEQDSTNIAAYANRASVNYWLRNYQNALTDYEQAHRIKPLFFNQIGHMLFFTGEKEKACEYYEKSLIHGDSDFDLELLKYCKQDAVLDSIGKEN